MDINPFVRHMRPYIHTALGRRAMHGIQEAFRLKLWRCARGASRSKMLDSNNDEELDWEDLRQRLRAAFGGEADRKLDKS